MRLFAISILYLFTFFSNSFSVSGTRFERDDTNPYSDLSKMLVFPNVPEHQPRIGELIRNGKVNDKDDNGRSPLYLAAERGDFQTVKLLTENGADVNTQNNEKWTPLHISSKNGHTTVVRLLVENGASVHATTDKDRTPLFEAAIAGQVDVVKILIEHGANVNAKDKDTRSPLDYLSMNEIRNGKAEVARLLLENGANVNSSGVDNQTPLFAAAGYGQLDVAKVLIEYKADVNAQDKYNWTPLHYAGNNFNIHDGKAELARLLIEHGANVNGENISKRTPLFEPAYYGQLEVAKVLIENGANVNVQDVEGWSPLHLLSWTEYTNDKAKIAELMLEKGANVNVLTSVNRSPLHDAAMNDQIEVAKLLRSYGAVIDAENNDKWTPLFEACKKGKFEMSKLLVEYGANVNFQNNVKDTPLHLAVQSENNQLIEFLLQNGAKRYAKNKDGVSSQDIARQSGNSKISELFEKAKLQNFQNACQYHSTDYIHNGALAKDGEFPWMAALGYVSESDYSVSFDCGGTIISNLFVLTAAHCVKVRQPSVVRMGKISLISLDTEDEFTTVNRHIKEIIYHPNHSSLSKRHDIALLRLKKIIPFSDNVKPACLQTDMRDEPQNVPLIVTGWGIISAKSHMRSNELRKTQLMTMPLAQCNTTLMNWGIPRSDPALRDGLIDGQYCAYDPQGRNDSCQGDSGGPLQYFPTQDSTVATLLGIVSFGVGCGSRIPSVYTRVAFYLDWIEPIVWPEL